MGISDLGRLSWYVNAQWPRRERAGVDRALFPASGAWMVCCANANILLYDR